MTSTTALLLLVLAIPTGKGEPPPRLVVDVSGSGSTETILGHLRSAMGESFDARVGGVEDAIDLGLGPWGLSQPGVMEQCTAEATTTAQLTADLKKVEALIHELEYNEARQRIEAVDGLLCGVTDPLTSDLLVRIPFLMGVILYYSNEHDAARDSFCAAVERRPDMDWDATFPPDPQQIFLDSVADAVRSSRTRLALPAGDRPDQLFIDGIEVTADLWEMELVGTTHHVQIGRGGQLLSAQLDTGGAEDISMFGPKGLEAGLALTPDTEAGAQTFGALVTAAQLGGHSEVWVLSHPQPDQAWRYNDIDRTWERVSLMLGRQLSRSRNAQRAGGALVGVGAALGVTGVIVGLSNYAQGMELQTSMLSDPGLYDAHMDEYQARQNGSAVGYVVMAVGGGLVATGIPLLIHGSKLQRAAIDDGGVAVTITPTGNGLFLTGRF